MYLEDAGRSVSLSDTVGFIRDLPHKLVEAFKATLQEAAEADLLLHVVDASSPVLEEQMVEVDRVIAEIGAHDVPQVLVFNKLDRIDASQRPRALTDWIDRGAGERVQRVFVSAVTGDGLDELRVILSRIAAPTDAAVSNDLDADSSTEPAQSEGNQPLNDPLDEDSENLPVQGQRTGTHSS
ncbi:MAG: GTPase HflX, partial [Rhizobacter sp.]|nr:GTPase HflX [Rhizobacter sp.]